jgi:hypothetical protein
MLNTVLLNASNIVVNALASPSGNSLAPVAGHTIREVSQAEMDSGLMGKLWNGSAFVAVSVPQSVTRRQAKQALLINSKLSLVQPAIDAIADPSQKAMIQIEWDDSQEFQRTRQSVIAIGTAIGLSSAQMDDLFILAATL